MQQNYNCNINIIFFLITESVSFIPDNILNCCEIINVNRPCKTIYNKCLQKRIKLTNTSKINSIVNIKNLYITNKFISVHKIICNHIIYFMINVNEIKFLLFRDLIYDIFIYNLNIYDCIWYILFTLVEKNMIYQKDFTKIILQTYCFFQYYNNNYRPIYHLEKYLLFITQIVHNSIK